ncbi:MAG TPA: hypothetical protein VJX67_19065 [Blastocatellia bacterium]|nr:hypothetical protein [Blastocatellia bacterium]
MTVTRSLLIERWPKLAVACLAGMYFLWCTWDVNQWHFIDGADLLIHEAGHIVFGPFGEFIMIAGGSMFQVIMPSIFVLYFVFQRKPYSAALVLFWVGESILNVSVYAKDSIAMQLPLIGGPDSIHDWNYLLTHTGLLSHTAGIAGAIRLAGTAVIAGALVWAIMSALKKDPTEPRE